MWCSCKMIIDCSLWSMFQILLIYSFEYEFNSGNQICLAYADDTWCWLIPLFWIFENFPGRHERTHIGLIIFTISELLILPFVVVYSNSFNIERSVEEWFENLWSYILKSWLQFNYEKLNRFQNKFTDMQRTGVKAEIEVLRWLVVIGICAKYVKMWSSSGKRKLVLKILLRCFILNHLFYWFISTIYLFITVFIYL